MRYHLDQGSLPAYESQCNPSASSQQLAFREAGSQGSWLSGQVDKQVYGEDRAEAGEAGDTEQEVGVGKGERL